MTPLERFIVDIESDPWSALWRAAVGFAMLPVFRFFSADLDSLWITSAMFIGVLVALRVVPGVLRHLLPFSSEAKEVWQMRRNLSKRYDSYAWQKLTWIGLGLVLYGAISGGLKNGELAVALFCLIGGGAGLAWCRLNAVQVAPKGES
jgi:hypothetical protein